MSRKSSILFKPSLGCKYIFKNTKTNECKVGKVLGPCDKKKYGEIKSGRKCQRGKEFFKVLINDKIIKMMNSNLNSQCISDDGLWMFTGNKPDKTSQTKKKVSKIKNIKPVAERNKIEFVSESALQKIMRKGI